MIVWAGDAATTADALDIFAQVYDAEGMPIGGEIEVDNVTSGVQDLPDVAFLSGVDSFGRSQFVVTWRDVDNFDGSDPNDSGVGYAMFLVDGLQIPEPGTGMLMIASIVCCGMLRRRPGASRSIKVCRASGPIGN